VLTLAHLRPEHEGWDVDRQVEVRIKAGRPIPLVDIRVVDTEMRDVPADGTTPGEIVARAPWLTQGYLRDPANSEKLWLGGWLHTGDIGVIGADGYLKITDRLKDVIKTGGEWVSSLDIEDLIIKHPGCAKPPSSAFRIRSGPNARSRSWSARRALRSATVRSRRACKITRARA
jgi:fatty-acyl-CoA synthase